ncbi:hypothetical protein P4U05_05045 [Bacillus paranthracis]|uniref:Lipoprotein n=1 Tax=Bacillus paranthracis TaxID=2026186 RepID=A0AAJ1NFA8_9BACI|nr:MULTISPECIES: hypothetical protein [Bacillus]ADY22285.1 hypothetical protein YBT020_15275 [Bacillus thuringiensis serovar finitimus YBT-020]MRC71067.1 hypothetical protein [Bacillus thuringiensis]OTX69749.1 hypothetical protein BK722_15220 [Bacillus thuringiensis serovar finitimus]MCR6797517.1 hypothetical protein [Bacillus paranthracis]MDG0949049.1 hypothetical protein [Bacillus paranthracis]
MFQKYNSLAIIVICTMFLFVACSKSDTELKDIQKVDYLVSYSNAMKAGGYIYAYDKKGNEISKIEVDGQSIMSNAKDGEGYYFSSNRNNNHYVINKIGKVQGINIPKELQDVNAGAYFIHAEQGYKFYDVNIGLVDEKKGYTSELVYWKENDKRQESVELKGTIQGAHIIENHIYAFSQTLDKVYISEIDLVTNKKTNEFEIPNENVYFAPTPQKVIFQKYKDKLILALSDNVNQKLSSKLMMINPKTKVVEKETVLDDKQFIPVLVQVYDNKVYVLNHDEKIKELDENLNIIRTYSLQSDKNTKIAREDKGISDIQVHGNKLYILYKDMNPKSETKQLVAEIEGYDLLTGGSIEKTTLQLERKWDDITFLVLKE